jgi:hypothetical protein
MAQCPICRSAEEEIDRGLFDGVGFDCKRHGRFRVSGTVINLMKSNEWPRRDWERALMLAQGEAVGDALPLITSDHFALRPSRS